MSSEQGTSDWGLDRSLRVQCGCTLLVAAASAYVSYQHGRAFAWRFGADESTALLWPLIVDGLLLMATIELWKTGGRRTDGQWKAWLAFALGIGLSLCANIASAPEQGLFAVMVASCPPLALLLSVELLSQSLKRHREETAGMESFSGMSATAPSPVLLPTTRSEESDGVDEVHTADERAQDNPKSAVKSLTGAEDSLCVRAYELDAEHWKRYQRPISAETLREELRIGSGRARALTRHVRSNRQPFTLQ